MPEQEVYRRFINWLNQTWWGLSEADELMPLIMARYTLNDTFFEQCSKKIDCLKFNQKNFLYILDHSECFFYNPFIKNGNL